MSEYHIFVIVVFSILLLWTMHLLKNIFRTIGNRGRVDFRFMSFISAISYLALLNAIVFASLREIGIQNSATFAAVWISGLAAGVYLKKPVSNFVAGILIRLFLLLRGDATVRHNGEFAVVSEVKAFETRLKLSENNAVLVSNSRLCLQYILN
jgi:small-conductance mechanosensitive channel